MPVLEAFLRVMADRCTPTKGGARHRYEGPIADSTGIPVRDQSRGDPSTERRAAESKDSYASGMAPVIDAMDLMHKRTLERVVMVSSDSDFERLAQSPREEDLKACGFGERKRDFSKTRPPLSSTPTARLDTSRAPPPSATTGPHSRSPPLTPGRPCCTTLRVVPRPNDRSGSAALN